MKHHYYFFILAAVTLSTLLSCTTEPVSPDMDNSNTIETGGATATLTSPPVTEQKETPTSESSARIEEQTATPSAAETPTPAPEATETPSPTPTVEFIPITNGPFTLVSVSSNGEQANGDAYDPAISADGRYIVFASAATNLIADDKNGAVSDVFLHDKVTGQTTLVSQNAAGEQGTGHSGSPGISADGRFVVFISDSWNMAGSQDKNFGTDVYLYDRETGEVTLISAPVPGSDRGNWDTRCPVISGNGRFIAFLSTAPNLAEKYVTGESPRPSRDFQLLVHDRELKATQLASVSETGELANEDVECPQISGDGSKWVPPRIVRDCATE